MVPEHEQRTIIEEGRQAYLDGLHRWDCPYTNDRERQKLWKKGHREGRLADMSLEDALEEIVDISANCSKVAVRFRAILGRYGWEKAKLHMEKCVKQGSLSENGYKEACAAYERGTGTGTVPEG